ncbi:hypothetical protein PV327_005739 [Microctonus hyperodae]|uniref:Sperm flagellar protein 2 n=1 Tax=Microctonus hyperodae TaxID=165561 RepID=A0AA39L049_MICHY|nr:hypothetical protein PV327_005739 [Microctonus hyperodae]
MAEIIRSWLRSRLGVIVDLRPEIFGRYCRDGTFLAKLLHSYDIINDSQLQTITQTSDPALARVNLRHLRCWLRFIGVDCDNACIEDISNGIGTASLRLFYKVFLCLENKDRLHFITLQKEREKYIPNSTKFDVRVVSEESPIGDLPDHPFSKTLVKDSVSLTNWYKKKFQKIINDCKIERDKFSTARESIDSLKKPVFNKFNVLQAKETFKKNEWVELDKFSGDHRVQSCLDYQSMSNNDIVSERSKIFSEYTGVLGNPEAAKQFIKTLKCRKHSMNATQNFKLQMQQGLLTDVWNKMADDQEREFDRIIAKKILDQSQYEKQMVTKLGDIRIQKNRIAANRRSVDDLMMNTRENEMRMIEETARQDKLRKREEIDDEYKRMNELHERIKVAKQRQRNRQLYRLTMKIVRDIIDISVEVSEFKRTNDNYIPLGIWNEWKALFNENLSIFELANVFNDREDNVDVEDNENSNDLIDVEVTKKNILNERNFEDYHNIKSPWNEFMPEFDDETCEYIRLGSVVLGYIVHKLLRIVYPFPQETMHPPLPDVKTRAVIIGIPNSLFYSPLRELLKHKKIQLFTVEDAINYCLHYYKEEMKDFDYVDVNITNESNENLSQSMTNDKKRERKQQKIQEKRKMSKTLMKKTSPPLKINNDHINKETQTPKVIPYEDIHPKLSNTAYIGKCVHEMLTHGEPVSDELIARVIMEYIKSLVKINGWVLLNYPNTHQQMAHLEFLFTGYKIPEQPDELNQLLNSNDMTLDEIDPRPSRITFALEDNDPFACCRVSELIPNPLDHNEHSSETTYLTAFIKVLPKLTENSDHKLNEEESFEFHPEDMTKVDRFYINEGVASAVYYTTFNNSILKRLAKLIIGEISLSGISSSQLFKNTSINLNDTRDIDNDNKKCILKVRMKPSTINIDKPSTPQSDVKSEQDNLESNISKPGESDWSWADLYLSTDIVEDLVTLWENLEYVYIDGLKEILMLKRIKFAGVVPYKDFIMQHMNNFIDDGVLSMTSSTEASENNNLLKDDGKSIIKKSPVFVINESDLKQEINNIILNVDEISKIDITQTSFFKIIQANIDYVQSIIDGIFTLVIEKLHRENSSSLRHSSDRKGKKRASKKRLSEKSIQSDHTIIGNEKIKNLLQEWEYALNFEVNRIRLRLLIIEAAKNSDIEFILDTMQRTFYSINHMLNEKYEKEIKSVNDIIKIFSLAIEEEISIQEEIILDDDSVSIRSYLLMYPDKVKNEFDSPREKSMDSYFTISQLGRLKDIFQRVAPSGFIAERSFIYILQDLITCPNEIPGIPALIASWYELKPNDIIELIHELFGDISYIDWREFLIYAMAIEMPSQDELLNAKEAFANKDLDKTGIIYREQFIMQPLWFLDSSQSSSLRSLLHENYERDEPEMFEEEFDIKSLTASFGSGGKLRKPKKTISFWIDNSQQFDSKYDIKEEQDHRMRMSLIKELLCEMYLNSYHTVNYMAMLLVFCKDDNPVYGFGKALCLAMGKPVCVDHDEGEKYLNMLLEEKRLMSDETIQQIRQRQDATEFSGKLVEELLDKTILISERAFTSSEILSPTIVQDTFHGPGQILIEKLDQPGETVDPLTLLIEESPLPNDLYDENSDIFSFSSIENSKQSILTSNSNEKIIYWLPINICEAVLSALVPFDFIQQVFSITGVSFTDNLKQVYRDVECKELDNKMEDVAFAYRVVNHSFIIQLLNTTSKFTSKNLSLIVENILNNKWDNE